MADKRIPKIQRLNSVKVTFKMKRYNGGNYISQDMSDATDVQVLLVPVNGHYKAFPPTVEGDTITISVPSNALEYSIYGAQITYTLHESLKCSTINSILEVVKQDAEIDNDEQDFLTEEDGEVGISVVIKNGTTSQDFVTFGKAVDEERLYEAIQGAQGWTRDYVADAINQAKLDGSDIDLTAYAKKSDLLDYYTKSQVNSLLPNLSNYATKQYVAEYVAQHGGTSSGTGECGCDLTAYYTKSEIDEQMAAIVGEAAQTYALKTDLNNLVSLSMLDTELQTYATREWVTSQLVGIGGGSDIDLSDYVRKEELPDLTPYALKSDIPSLAGYATEFYVLNYVSEHAGTGECGCDLTPYATKEWTLDHLGTGVNLTDYCTHAQITALTLANPTYPYAINMSTGDQQDREKVFLDETTYNTIGLWGHTYCMVVETADYDNPYWGITWGNGDPIYTSNDRQVHDTIYVYSTVDFKRSMTYGNGHTLTLHSGDLIYFNRTGHLADNPFIYLTYNGGNEEGAGHGLPVIFSVRVVGNRLSQYYDKTQIDNKLQEVGGAKIVRLTQYEYDRMSNEDKDKNTLYIIW